MTSVAIIASSAASDSAVLVPELLPAELPSRAARLSRTERALPMPNWTSGVVVDELGSCPSKVPTCDDRELSCESTVDCNVLVPVDPLPDVPLKDWKAWETEDAAESKADPIWPATPNPVCNAA